MLKQKKSGGFRAHFFAAFLLFLLEKPCSAGEIPVLEYRVMHTLPHDVTHFTQGLVYREGRLFESAGGYGTSAIHEKELSSGKTVRARKMPADLFAEGLTLLDNELFLLSWRNGIGFVFDRSLRERRRFRYAGEGWGLTDNGRQLIMSDGSSTLRWINAKTWTPLRELEVREGTRAVTRLNELEYARGFIFANIWYSDRIAVIAPDNGQVRAWLDLSALRRGFARPAEWGDQEQVLNGIAYDSQHDLFYVTGKRWPLLYALRITLPVAGGK